MDSRWARVARGWTAAGFAVFVAAFSHATADGNAPSLFGILVSLVLSGTLCTLLAGRTQALWRLVLSVGVSQLFFHWLFSGMGTPVIVGHDMGSMSMDAAASSHHNTPAMWLAHVAAAVITIVALRYAGAAFWGVADTARLVLSRLAPLLVPMIPAPPTHVAVADRTFVPNDLALLLSPMRHRGPPLGIA